MGLNSYLESKKYRQNLFLIGLIILKSTQASVLAFSPITTVLCFLYAWYVFIYRGCKFDKLIFQFVLVYVVINLCYYISLGSNNFVLAFYVLIKFLYAYMTIKIVQEDFFPIYEKIIYYLAFISLPLFVIQLINYKALFAVIGIVQNNIDFLNYRNDRFANLFFFTLESHGSVFRNSGFAWEPKGFANFLVLAILINVLNQGFKFNKRLIVFLLALITTTSTTGYLITFFLIPMFYLYNSKIKSSLLMFFLLVPISLFVLSLDFGYEKIKREIKGRDEYIELLEDDREFESRSLGRFPSLMVDVKDFLKKPIIGYGFNSDKRTQSAYTKLVRVNGFSDLLATFGAIGIIFFAYSYFKAFKSYISVFNYKGVFIILIIFFVIYFASTLTTHPFWLMLCFLFLINWDSDKIKLKYKVILN